MSVYNLNTHFGAYLFREKHFNPNGIVGFMTFEILEAYIDASGKDTNISDKVLAVTGCLSTPSKWQDFDNDWQSFLKAEGFPKDSAIARYVFHTSPFWTEPTPTKRTKQRIYRSLIEIIAKHTLFRFGHIVLLDDFRQLEAEYPFLRELLSGKPGTMMSEMCIKKNSEWAKENGYNPLISYVFDRGDEFWGELFSQFSLGNKLFDKEYEILEGEYKSIGSLTCGNKAIYSGIQAADILAWECRQAVLRQRPIDRSSRLASKSRPRPEMMLLGSPSFNHFYVYDRKALKHELFNKFAWMLEKMNLEDTASILVGEGKAFEGLEDLMKFSLKIRKDDGVRQHKARQTKAKEKKKL